MLDHPGHATIKALNEGKVVDLDGLLFIKDEGELAPGDTYIGARNTVDVYVFKMIVSETCCVYPEGIGYPFYIGECVKVRFAETGATASYVVPDNCLHSKALAK